MQETSRNQDLIKIEDTLITILGQQMLQERNESRLMVVVVAAAVCVCVCVRVRACVCVCARVHAKI